MPMIIRKPEDFILNESLLRKQRINEEDENLIRVSHTLKDGLFKKMSETDDKEELRTLAKLVENLEFIQQKLWGFPLDESFHLWYLVPKCTCPKMDNREATGVKNHRIIVSDCPIHWTDEKQKSFEEQTKNFVRLS